MSTGPSPPCSGSWPPAQASSDRRRGCSGYPSPSRCPHWRQRRHAGLVNVWRGRRNRHTMMDMVAALELAEAARTPLLSVSGVSVRFGAVRALDGVSLTVRPGELVALAGENGAGKTTLVRCIAGDIAPNDGEIALAGRRVSADPVAMARQGVAVVWQDLALCDNLDIAANVLLGRERRGLLFSDSRFHGTAGKLLASLGIPLLDTTRPVRSLSGGQRQLVAVARAMGSKPRLLALDEPTA